MKNEGMRIPMAKDAGLQNEPSPEFVANLVLLIDRVLDPLRERYGKRIIVNSGYRSPQLNVLLGGAKNSAHMSGQAADITAGSKDGNRQLFLLAQELKLPFDQLIDESNYAWVHISHKADGTNRGQILHLS